MAASLEEQAWIRTSQEGNAEAFENLVRRYQHMIHSLTYRMTGSMSDAEDLAQETFIRAFRQVGSFRAEASFSSWLYRIGVNTCLNWQRKRLLRERADQQWIEDREAAGEPAVSARVREALMALTPKQRAAIILTVYEGMNHAEAAQALGCSETTVSWRIFVARKKLKKILRSKVLRPEVEKAKP